MNAPLNAPSNATQLSDALARAPFFELMGFLERTHPQAKRVGEQGPFAQEVVQLRHDPSLRFATREVTSVESLIADNSVHANKAHAFSVTTAFLGLTGASSPLPTYLAEEVAQADDEDNPQVTREFLDLFHHRLLSLLYRGVSHHSIAPEIASGPDNPWFARVLSLSGVDEAAHPQWTYLRRERILRVAPLLVTKVRSAKMIGKALDVLLGDYLGDARCEIEEFAGAWTPLDTCGRACLMSSRLGRTTALGGRVYSPSSGIKIHISRLPPADAASFEDGQAGYLALCEALLLLLDEALDFTICLEIQAQAGDGHKDRSMQVSGRIDQITSSPVAEVEASPHMLPANRSASHPFDVPGVPPRAFA